jgi:hypothetical protein
MKTGLTILLLILIQASIFGQTQVSGGIYQNTTWPVSGSPYIVTGSIVVFPGKTLTIEPGCKVIFNADSSFNIGNFLYLEIRGTLIAQGTDTNRICFTSSDTTDGFYNWLGINIKGSQGGSVILDRIELQNSFYGIYNDISQPGVTYSFTNSRFKNNNYALQLNADLVYLNCVFEKNGIGQAAQLLYGSTTASDCLFKQNLCSFTWSNYINVNNSVFIGNTNNIVGSPGIIQNSTFLHNETALAQTAQVQVINCVFDSNQVAIDDNGFSTISFSEFYNNNVAVKIGESSILNDNIIVNNVIGVQVNAYNPSTTQITNNEICSNLVYNLENLTDKNFQVNANCFCSPDSSVIEVGIYDGYDDITRGLVNFAIYDDSCETITALVTKIILNENTSVDDEFINGQNWTVWSFNHELFIDAKQELEIKIYNITGQELYTRKIPAGKNRLSLTLPDGVYVVRSNVGEAKKVYLCNN